jgi:hypothetical protein
MAVVVASPRTPLASSVQSIIVTAVTGDHAEGVQYHVLPTDDPVRALNILREAAGLQPLSDEHDDRAAMIVVGSADILVTCCAVWHLVARTYALPPHIHARVSNSHSPSKTD